MRPHLLATTLAATILSASENDCTVEVACRPIEPVYLSLWHREGKGVGFDKGYSSIELFLPQYKKDGGMIPYLDMRGHIFNDGKFAGNLGVGLRTYLDGYNSYLGPNVYFDLRRKKGKTFYQVGFGLELIKPCWSLTGNGYLPLGRRVDSQGFKFEKFEGNQAIIREKAFISMFGADIRYNRTIWDCGWAYVDLSVAPYYYWGAFGKSAGGGYLRARARFLDIITVGAKASYDSLFRWRGLAEIGATFKFGGKKCTMKRSRAEREGCCCVDPLMRNVAKEPDRQEIIVLSKQKRSSFFRDPEGNPYVFVHVNNLVDEIGASGAGTFEFPYSTLSLAEANSGEGEILYIHAGNRTPVGMSSGITLQSKQQLLGSGVTHLLPSSKQIPISIPPLTPGINPRITHIGGTAITLTSIHTISGIDIPGSTGPGIVGTSIRFGSTIDRCQIVDPVGSGILLSFEEGTTVQGTFTITNNFITGATDAIQINNSAGGTGDLRLDVVVTNNELTSNADEGIEILRTAETGDFTLTGIIDGNQFDDNGDFGLAMTYTGTTTPIILDLIFSNNIVREHTDAGVNFQRSNGQLQLLNNTMAVNADEGLIVQLDTGCVLGCRCIGNTCFDAGDSNGFFFDNTSDGRLTIDFFDNFVDGVPQFGNHFQFDMEGGALTFVRMGGNQGNIQLGGTQGNFILIK